VRDLVEDTEVEDMDGRLLFQKALLQLDRENYKDGEANLRRVIDLAEESKDEILQARAMCSLGDLLHSQGHHAEAVQYLQKTLSFKRDDDLLAYELERAAHLLLEIRGTS
jgi:tetratricopeptide (TPR) repeat protein